MELPRNEYPRPQFARGDWVNLNGEWSCRFDYGCSGKEQGWQNAPGFEDRILVPFCPESTLSGLHHTDFIPALWYQRKIVIPAHWKGKKILLHCGGIDYRCEVYLDGNFTGTHTGTGSPVTLELEKWARCGEEQNLVIFVRDDTRGGIQPLGKQAPMFRSKKCNYTRTTGIWQTVWLEAVDPAGLHSCRITPDFDSGAFSFTPVFWNACRKNTLQIRLLEQGRCVAERKIACSDGVTVTLPLPDPKEWNPETPFLYDVEFSVTDPAGKRIDLVSSYAGLRKIHAEGDKLYLNNQPVYLRFVLDQGYYPEGVWTAPSDEALKNDILLAKSAGFNGARLHQKVFEERFHYWADHLGYLTWAEFPDWGMGFWQHFTRESGDYHHSFRDYFAQWSSVVLRDVNHPSIIAWTPFNETCSAANWEEHYRMISDIYDLTKALDPSRPVNDSSGYVHAKTDLWSAHNYEPCAEKLKTEMDTEPVWNNCPDYQRGYRGQPYFVDEYGGVGYLPEERKVFADNSWGYGDGILSDPAAALKRIRELTDVLVIHPKLSGYCYTQLTDIEQEQNGLYFYERTPKFDMKQVREIFSRKPSWSKW